MGREDDEHPLPPGPWDPHIRRALEQIYVLGPHPEPWRRHDAERFFDLPPGVFENDPRNSLRKTS